jgi:hypothetical protein
MKSARIIFIIIIALHIKQKKIFLFHRKIQVSIMSNATEVIVSLYNF